MPTIQDTICTQVFRKLEVDHLVRGTTRVSWDLGSNFRDPMPHTFVLQVGRTGATTADDWTDVGVPTDNVFFLDDPVQRLYGKTVWTHYRIQLTTPIAVYYSQPVSVLGRLTPRDRRIIRELLRKEKLRHRLFVSEVGYILKRRLYGTPCDCIDELTNEVRDSDCDQCYSTGIVGGFFAALPDQYVEISPDARHEQLDLSARGTVNPMVISGRYSGIQLNENDVWVHKSSDRRYYIHSVKNLAEIRGVPLIVQVELREAPATDPIYDFPLV